MNGTVQIVVHFGMFKNVDLFRQGLYCVKATLHSRRPPAAQKPVPINDGEGLPYHLVKDKKLDERTLANKRVVYPSSIQDTIHAFYSKTFRVQYVDQEVELEDACLFHYNKAYNHGDRCYLALELLFAEYNSTDYAMRKDYPELREFEMVSQKWIAVNLAKNHGAGFYPCTFDDSHFCLMDVMVHFCLTDYNFKKISNVQIRPPPSASRSDQKTRVIELRTFEEYLFPKNVLSGGRNVYTEKQVRDISHSAHLKYTSDLIDAYNSLARLAVRFDQEVEPLKIPAAMLRTKSDRPPAPQGQAPAAVLTSPPAPVRDATTGPKATPGPSNPASLDSSATPKAAGAAGAAVVTPSSRPTTDRKTQGSAATVSEKPKSFGFPALSRFGNRIKWDKEYENNPKVCSVVSLMLTKDIKDICGQNYMLWHRFIRSIPQHSKELKAMLRARYESVLLRRLRSFVSTERFSHNDRLRTPRKDMAKTHDRYAAQIRRASGADHETTRVYSNLAIYDPDVFPAAEDHVVAFEEVFAPCEPQSEFQSHVSGELKITSGHFTTSNSEISSEPASQAPPSPTRRGAAAGETTASRVSSPDRGSGSRHQRHGTLVSEAAGENEGEDKHVLVFVHGYQGNSWDMRLFKNHLALLFPNHLCMLSSANEGHTEGDIGKMGERLALEIVDFIQENCPLGFRKLSFVAHSLGGLISRAALACKELQPYVDKMHTYVSLASPHCGYMYSENKMLDAGIWVLKKWSKSLCLTQLSMSDDSDPKKCFIYKLSEKKGLEYFQNCMLLASHQDGYSPFHSSRIELHTDATNDKKARGKTFVRMVQNLLYPLKNGLRRFDISFVNKKRANLDSFIGRTAHILFLDNHLYMLMTCYIFRDLFA